MSGVKGSALSQIRALRVSLCCQIIFPIFLIVYLWMALGTVNYLLQKMAIPGEDEKIYVYPRVDLYHTIEALHKQNDTNVRLPTRFLFTQNSGLDLGDLSPHGNGTRFMRFIKQFKSHNLATPNIFVPYSTNYATQRLMDEYLFEELKKVGTSGRKYPLADLFGSYIFEKMGQNSMEYTIQSTRDCGSFSNWGGALARDPSCPFYVRSMITNVVNNGFIRSLTGEDVEISTSIQMMPFKYKQEVDLTMFQFSGAGTIITILLFPLPLFMYSLVLEKNEKLREMMRLNGLKLKYYWLTMIGVNGILYLFPATVVLLGGYILQLPLIINSSIFITIVFLLLSGCTVISMSFLLSTFFSSPLAAIVIGYLFAFLEPTIGSLISTFLIAKTGYQFIFLLLFPPLPIHVLIEVGVGIACGEGACPGFKDIFSTSMISVSLLFMVLNITWMSLLAYYLDNVLPQAWGIRKKPWFCLEPAFSLIKRLVKREKTTNKPKQSPDHEDQVVLLEEITDSVQISTEEDDIARERETAENMNPSDAAILLKGLKKKYGPKLALNDLYLTIQKGECFALLGPNGAGKTTTINILCGLYPPTSGIAYVNGYNIRSEMDKVRLSLGFCPQHEIFWPELTVQEHLLFYARLKGVARTEEKKHVRDLLKYVGLHDLSGNSKASQLSGGMKKRLGIAMSIVGDPAIVLLDEPTTGLDPTTRRHIWDVIEKAKKDKCIILTTHSLEEADILSTKIGILSSGKLQCIGDSFYLKNKFGEGYRLTLNFDELQREQVTNFILSLAPNATIISQFAGNSTFNLPKDLTLSWLFSEIEKQKENIKIKDYALSQTTLEDVFMRIIQDEEGEQST